MSEGVDKKISQEDVFKIFIENRYGSKVYDAYSTAISSGEIKSVDDAVSFLDKTARKIDGKLLTEPQLDRHNEKIIAEIRRLIGEKKGIEIAKYLEGKLVGLAKYFGVETELDQEESKESGKRLTKKCVEDLLNEIRSQVRVVALAVGYAQPEYIEGKGGVKKLNPDYFSGLVAYIRAHYASCSGQISKIAQLETNLSDSKQANRVLEQEKIDLMSQNASLVQKLEEMSKENERLSNELKKLEWLYPTVEDFIKKAKEKTEQGGK
ncbi:MAG: hypothetical protein QW666_00185 [Candidatus Woesearchaeota archaeon]